MSAADVPSMPDDVYTQHLRGTIEGLRYWVPSIIDVAHVAEESDTGYWHLQVAPRLPGGCPFEILLRDNRSFDAVLAGEAYEGRSVAALSVFMPLVAAIIDGRVIQRRWFSTQTGALRAVETLVYLPDGSVWREGEAADEVSESRDRHFLPYRR
jgi:hypothetical protein